MMGWNSMMGWNGAGTFFGGFFWLLLLGGLVVGVVLLLRNSGNSASAKPEATPREPRQTPIEILEMRYAKGDIDREEYESRRRDLESTSITSR